MKERAKRALTLVVVFGMGLGIGVVGGYVLNDVTSREDPNAIQQIRQELEQQQQLDDFFADQEAARSGAPQTDSSENDSP